MASLAKWINKHGVEVNTYAIGFQGTGNWWLVVAPSQSKAVEIFNNYHGIYGRSSMTKVYRKRPGGIEQATL